MLISCNLVSAPLADLRRLSLLAALAAANDDVDPEMFVQELKGVFQGLPECLNGDVQALHAEGLVLPDDSIARTNEVTVTEAGRMLVQRLQTSVESNSDACVAVVAAMVLHYVHTHKDQVRRTSTDALRDAGVRLFARELPDDCVEEAIRELYDLGLVDGTVTMGGHVILSNITSEGRTLLRIGDPVLVPGSEKAGVSSVFNTTINGGVQGQNVAVASQGDVHQDATINIDQATADLRVAVNDLYTALAGQEDLQDKIDALLEQLDKAEDQGSKSRMARALSGLCRLAGRVAGKLVDTTVALAVTEAATPLLKALGS